MAKAVAICRCKTCGEEFKKETVKRNRTEADSWEEWAQNYYDECPDCYQKRIQAERDAANEEAAGFAKEAELPELIGTEKQVAWANKIRWDLYESTQDTLDKAMEIIQSGRNPERREKRQRAYDECVLFSKWIFSKTEASFWIDHREIFGAGIKRALDDFCIHEKYLKEKEEIEFEGVVSQIAPTIVEPENKISTTVCEINATETEVIVRSAKDQGVIDLVKSCGYRWNGSVWRKEITVTTGSAEDRLIEIGNRLLVAGYPVKADPEYHDRIISGQYDPESKRWIIRDDGQIRILTGKDEDLEIKARKLPGASKYGRITVPASAWQEIEDFARIHDFRISPGAREAMDGYKASVVTVSPVKGAEAEYHEENTAAILDSSRDVLEDLKEEE